MEDDNGVEYSHYDQVLAFLTVTNICTRVKSNWAIVQPLEEVWLLVLPSKTNVTARACVDGYDHGSLQGVQPLFGRREPETWNAVRCVRPYQRRFVLVHAETIISAAHLIQDSVTTDCYYVADTTFNYRWTSQQSSIAITLITSVAVLP
jgi:hypothetical protein